MNELMTRWRLREADVDAVQKLALHLDLPDVVARILVARGYSNPMLVERFLSKSVHDLGSPFDLDDMEKAAARVCQAIERNENILVHGDFDTDGIAATAVLTLFLVDLGASVVPFVPNRLVEGHGISVRAIELAQSLNIMLFLTCDCGSSSDKEVLRLHEMGIDTVVTDHHFIMQRPKGIEILVNPKRVCQGTNQEDLAGVGVAFMLMVAVRASLRDRGFFVARKEPNLREYLDIVALGTVADLAPLVGQNRLLVAQGLDQLSISQRPGILAMKELAKLTDTLSIGTQEVGFRLAPRINAAARLGHADEALKLLMSKDSQEAMILAKNLETWNQERKDLQVRMIRMASFQAEQQCQDGARVLIVSSHDFHPGVVGLVAQNLAERFYLPCFVFSVGSDLAIGSGRAPGHVHLTHALQACSDLLLTFGGHAQAAGCTLRASDFSTFKMRFQDTMKTQQGFLPREVMIDAEANFGHLNNRFFAAFNRLRPFGVGNPEPVFSTRAQVVGEPREVGKDHVRVTLRDMEGPTYLAVGFNKWRSLGVLLRGTVEVAYTPEENEWQGKRDIQIRLHGVRPL